MLTYINNALLGAETEKQRESSELFTALKGKLLSAVRSRTKAAEELVKEVSQ